MKGIQFGSPLYNYNDGLEMMGNSSPQAQVEYLRKCLRIQSEEIDTLKLKLKTVDLEKQVQVHEMETMLEGLEKARQWLKNQRLASERGRSTPFLNALKTRKTSLFSNKRFAGLLISFCALVVFLLVLSLKLKAAS